MAEMQSVRLGPYVGYLGLLLTRVAGYFIYAVTLIVKPFTQQLPIEVPVRLTPKPTYSHGFYLPKEELIAIANLSLHVYVTHTDCSWKVDFQAKFR